MSSDAHAELIGRLQSILARLDAHPTPATTPIAPNNPSPDIDRIAPNSPSTALPPRQTFLWTGLTVMNPRIAAIATGKPMYGFDEANKSKELKKWIKVVRCGHAFRSNVVRGYFKEVDSQGYFKNTCPYCHIELYQPTEPEDDIVQGDKPVALESREPAAPSTDTSDRHHTQAHTTDSHPEGQLDPGLDNLLQPAIRAFLAELETEHENLWSPTQSHTRAPLAVGAIINTSRNALIAAVANTSSVVNGLLGLGRGLRYGRRPSYDGDEIV
ncbi:hypothetical protein K490DRAFT_65590 [Saccharata proteae CBS 121410]|uniref:Uncharacterized protein n=1 Tax=Saccharata proteae CBS 121410 TaxID=1314787 RepID=A0A9P4LVQ9_9PEZI|nr:hypothetical protein K490DRAFT_65590 [Saccharata proteae CBS 121410]